MGGYSKTNIYGGTSAKIGFHSKTSGDCSGHRGALPQNRVERNVENSIGFSESSSSDRLTEEQENEIAENIFDWWISGKPYKQWYSEKFCQLKFDFKDEE